MPTPDALPYVGAMCGRFTLLRTWAELVCLYRIAESAPPPNWPARYNVAPTQDVAVVHATGAGNRRLSTMRWGLVPAWAKDLGIGARMINARAETLAEKPAFRQALRSRRCLIPADGFYEWQPQPGRSKRPCYFSAADGGPLALAGLWERWDRAPDGASVFSCTIVTVAANPLLRPVHDRMPAILYDEAQQAWLEDAGTDVRAAVGLLQPAPVERLQMSWIGTFVNAAANEGPRCIEPVAAFP